MLYYILYPRRSSDRCKYWLTRSYVVQACYVTLHGSTCLHRYSQLYTLYLNMYLTVPLVYLNLFISWPLTYTPRLHVKNTLYSFHINSYTKGNISLPLFILNIQSIKKNTSIVSHSIEYENT